MLDIVTLHKMLYGHFNIEQPNKPTMLDSDHMKMRLNFLLEELKELAIASGFSISVEDGELSFVKDSVIEIDKEGILDAIIDLQVVLLGTAYLMGLFNKVEKICVMGTFIKQEFEACVFEEAYSRVWQSNIKKVRCNDEKESKRGFIVDLKKPDGWIPPDLSDLVKDM